MSAITSTRELSPDELLAFSNATFHITYHGIDDLLVFADREDKRQFLFCFERVLSGYPFRDSQRRLYPKVSGVELLGFNVLDNHPHLLLHQFENDGIRRLMRSVTAGYGKYFNKKYGRVGPLFREPYSSVLIEEPRQFRRTLGYVHLNHEEKKLGYEFSSHSYYTGERTCDWVNIGMGLRPFSTRDGYRQYMAENSDAILALKAERRANRSKFSGRKPPAHGPGSHFRRPAQHRPGTRPHP